MKTKNHIIIAILVLFFGEVSINRVFSEEKSLYDHFSDYTVHILVVKKDNTMSSFSGVVYDKNVVTTFHGPVPDDVVVIVKFNDGTVYQAKILHNSIVSKVVILEIKNIPVLPKLSVAKDVKPDQDILIVGYPGACMRPLMSRGYIASPICDCRIFGGSVADKIVAYSDIVTGNSGGPAFRRSDKALVGLSEAILFYEGKAGALAAF